VGKELGRRRRERRLRQGGRRGHPRDEAPPRRRGRAGRLDQEYEAALDKAFAEAAFGYERADDLPWTEIDFEEDVVRARKLARTL
jgi:hypothetical protein